MTVSAVSAGSVSIDFYADVAKLIPGVQQATQAVVSGAQQMQGALDVLRKSLETLGISASLVGFVEMIRGAIEAAEHLQNLHVATDLSVQDLAGLSLVAKQSGTDLDGLAKAVARMSVEMGKSPDKFVALGVTAKDGAGALKQFADIFNDLTDVQQRNALAQAVFKKSWQEIAPVLSLGSAGIDEAMQKGIAMSAVTAELTSQSKEFNDKWIELTGTGGFLNQQLGTILPLLNSVAGTLVELKGDTSQLDDGAFHPFAETLKQLVLFAGNLAFVLNGVGREIGAIAAQIGAGVFTDAGQQIHKLAVQDAENARAAFDRWEKQIQSTGTALQVVGDTSDALSRRLAVSHRAEQEAAAARAKAFLDGQNAAKDSQAAYDNLIKRIQERIDADNASLELGRELTAQELLASHVRTELAAILAKFPGLSRAYVEAKLAELKVDDLETQVQKSEIAYALQLAALRQSEKNTDYAQSAAGVQAIADAWAAELKTVNDSIKAQQAEAEAEHLVIGLNVSHAEAVEMVTIARLQDAQTRTVVDGEAYKALQDQIDGHQKLLGLLHDKSGWDTQLALIQSMEQEGKTLWDDLWSGGHNTLQKLGADIKKFLIDELYQLVIKQWVINVSTNLIGGLTSTLANTALGGVLAKFGIGAAGSLAGSAATTGGFSLAASNGAFTSAVGGSAGAMGALSAIPVAGWIAAGAILDMAMNKKAGISPAYSLLAPGIGVGLMGLEKLGIVQAPGGPKTTSAFGAIARDGVDSTDAGNIAQAIQAQYTALAGALGITNTKLASLGVFYSQDPKGTAQTQLQIAGGSYLRSDQYGGNFENVARGDDALKQAVALASTQLIVKNLQDAVGGPVGGFLKGINITASSIDDLNAALKIAQDVSSLDQSLAALGNTFANVTSQSAANQNALIQQFGGVSNLTSALGTYYQNFYTAAEQQDAAMTSLTTTFQQAGLVVPATRDAFRALVDAQDLSTDAGRKAYQVLMQNAGAFAALVPAAQDAASAISQTMLNLQAQTAKLQVALLTAQGQTAAAQAAQYLIDTAGMTDAEKALFDYNAALQAQIDSLNAATAAAQAQSQADAQAAAAIAQQAAAVLQQRQGLQTQLLQAEGNTAALRAEQLAALDPTNRAIQQQIYALQDQAAADQAATAAAQAAAQAQAAIAQQRYGLETTLLQLQGNTAALRARELALLDPSNRALQEQIWALQDAQAATNAHTAALQKQAQAAAALKQSWTQVTDSLTAEINRIRGLVNPGGQQSLSAAETSFAIATAQARSGSLTAAQSLPGLSQTLTSLALANAATELDYRRILGQTAGSLGLTNSVVSGQQGINLAPVVAAVNTTNAKLTQMQTTLDTHTQHIRAIRADIRYEKDFGIAVRPNQQDSAIKVEVVS